MQQVWWIWALGSLTALVLEACLGGSFIFVFFAFGAAVTAGGVGVCVLGPVWQQALCFCSLTAASLAVLRRPLMQWGQRKTEEHDPNSLCGSAATVQVAMLPQEMGRVLHRGTVWMARNIGASPLGPGTPCRVTAVDNLTLMVQAETMEPHL